MEKIDFFLIEKPNQNIEKNHWFQWTPVEVADRRVDLFVGGKFVREAYWQSLINELLMSYQWAISKLSVSYR